MWGDQGLVALLRGNLLSLENVALLSSLTLRVISGLLTLRSDGDVLRCSRDPATQTRQVRAASDESSSSEARRSRVYLRREEWPPPRPGPPRQLSARSAGLRPWPTAGSPASAALWPWPTGRRALQQPRSATTPQFDRASLRQRATRSRRHGATPPPGSSLRNAVAMETCSAPAAVKQGRHSPQVIPTAIAAPGGQEH